MLKPFPLNPEKVKSTLIHTRQGFHFMLERAKKENIPVSTAEAISRVEIFLDYKIRVMPWQLQFIDAPRFDRIRKLVDEYYQSKENQSKSNIRRELSDIWADLFNFFQLI